MSFFYKALYINSEKTPLSFCKNMLMFFLKHADVLEKTP